MDYKKDIKDIDIASRHPSNGMIAFGVTISKKCERLATAIYLVTNFLSDTEPMKSRLRTLSLELVRDASFIKNGGKMMEHNVLEALRANIEETISLLELAFIAGLASEMNFTILKREYVSLRNTIEVKKVSRESQSDSILGDNFFAPQFRTETSALARTAQPLPKGHSIGQMNITMSDRKAPAPFLKPNTPNLTPAHTPRAITDIAKESRRTRILKLIKDNREVTIKDIVAHFPELSEKTIQRELVAMSDSGVLKKFGERRWSRYAIA
ncbi:MAG: DeoR family transcriptional regulator [Candidatus Yonathbacteria bacterium]|nr:DeoR family transcriptional regulator [Candidatus Yonathbacteria bacterium]